MKDCGAVTQVWGHVVNELGNKVKYQVRDQVWGQVRVQVDNQLWVYVIDQIQENIDNGSSLGDRIHYE